jgi:hypothetical protein
MNNISSSTTISTSHVVPPSPTRRAATANTGVGEEISFDPNAKTNAQTLLDTRTREFIEINGNMSKDFALPVLDQTLSSQLQKLDPAIIGAKEGKLSSDILDFLLPALLRNNEGHNNLGHFKQAIVEGKLPGFLQELENDSNFTLDSWLSLLRDKPTLKNVLGAVDQALTTADGATPGVAPLFKPLIDTIGDDTLTIANPTLQRESTGAKQTLLMKLGNTVRNPVVAGAIGIGNAVKNPVVAGGIGIIALGAGLEFRGVTDFIPGPSKGATNPPAQVAKGDVMKAITGFSVENASELEKQSQEIIQGKIDGSLKELKDQSISVTGYYGGTLKPLTLENAINGVQVQAKVRTQANDQDGKPSVIIFQPGNSSTQIIIAPTEAVKANPLKQVPNNELIIVEIPLGAPGTRKPATGNLESLFNP